MKVSLWAEIHRLHDCERLSIRAIATHLHCSRDTVDRALKHAQSPPPAQASRGSIIDPYKPQIDALIEKYPELSAVRVLEEIAKKGYPGEVTLIRDHLRVIRPVRGRVYQEVDYAPGEAMQVDWGSCDRVRVVETIRKVSVFVAVLCFSRLIYIEFSLSQTKAHFYRCFVNALRFFGGVVNKCIVDNFTTAVAEGSGRTARFQAEFLEFCAYHRLHPWACEKADPESKGVVEGGVRYVKKNALAGRAEELTSIEAYMALAVYWRDKIANVRNHETTQERPIDRFEKERALLKPLPPIPYDTDEVVPAVVTPHARVRFDTNRYSVPPAYTRKTVILRADNAWVRVVHAGQEIARHRRSFERRQRIVDPEHRIAALALRKRSQVRQIEAQFDALGNEAQTFRRGLLTVPVKPVVHLRRLLGLVRLYGKAQVVTALRLAVEFQTFDAAYVINILDQERRKRQLPSPMPLTPKRRELIEEIDLDEPDPGAYDRFLDTKGEEP
jgi:transposase